MFFGVLVGGFWERSVSKSAGHVKDYMASKLNTLISSDLIHLERSDFWDYWIYYLRLYASWGRVCTLHHHGD